MKGPLKRLKYNYLAPAALKTKDLLLGRKDKNSLTLPDTPSVFFVFGSGRNGSTLLALLLNRHSKLFLPPEQYALPYSSLRYHLNILQPWASLTEKIISNFEEQNYNWKWEKSDFQQVANTIKQWEKEYQNIPNLFSYLVKEYGNSFGKKFSMIGDHSPISTVHYSLIARDFPDAPYIFILRDPLDVLYSYINVKNNLASDPIYGAWKWNQSIKAYKWLKENNKKVTLIRYKDLVSHPEKVVSDIFSFLDLPNEEVLKETEVEAKTDLLGSHGSEYHKNLYKPISKDSIGKGRKNMDPGLIKKIWPLLKKNAEEFGYPDPEL